ncbi:MAG: hypothetical protein AAF921_16525 [Cyanobacteria bacterium P01_D01_bin.44]
MKTFETITITIPVSDEYSFDALREKLASMTNQTIASTTLYDWIKDVCRLRASGIYKATYTANDLSMLVTWLAFRRICKRGTAAKKFKQYLIQLTEEQTHASEQRAA